MSMSSETVGASEMLLLVQSPEVTGTYLDQRSSCSRLVALDVQAAAEGQSGGMCMGSSTTLGPEA